MSGIAWCVYNNSVLHTKRHYVYIHTPLCLEDIPLNKAGSQDKLAYGIGRDNELNDFIGVKSDEDYTGPTDKSHPYIKEIHWAKDPSIYYTTQVLDKIKKMYYSTEKPVPCKYDIAIHIRRGDVGEDTRWKGRYVSNHMYVDFINLLRKEHPNYSICIYSEGNVDDFKEFKNLNVHFALNDDIKTTFHGLVTAKILVTAISSFSYAAALLSEGDIYTWPSTYEKPMPHWNIININEDNKCVSIFKNINIDDILLKLKKGEICEIENSPHFKALNGDDTEYLNYTEKYFTPKYVPKELLMDFKELANDFEYLKEDYKHNFITIIKHEPGRYRTVDGDHRLTIMKHRGHENVLCEMI